MSNSVSSKSRGSRTLNYSQFPTGKSSANRPVESTPSQTDKSSALLLPLLMAFCLLLVFPPARLWAQTAPSPRSADYQNRWDFFGGAAYAHFNGIGNVPATNLIGFNLQATAWATPVFGVAASVRGDYGNYPIGINVFNITHNPPVSQNLFLFGPEFRVWRTPTHALNFHVFAGGVYGKFESGLNGAPPNSVGLYTDQLAFASAIGGSFDYNLSDRLAVRIVTDYAPTHYGSANQQEFAGAAGVVYRLGSLHRGK